jgi:hypothetical protein
MNKLKLIIWYGKYLLTRLRILRIEKLLVSENTTTVNGRGKTQKHGERISYTASGKAQKMPKDAQREEKEGEKEAEKRKSRRVLKANKS